MNDWDCEWKDQRLNERNYPDQITFSNLIWFDDLDQKKRVLTVLTMSGDTMVGKGCVSFISFLNSAIKQWTNWSQSVCLENFFQNSPQIRWNSPKIPHSIKVSPFWGKSGFYCIFINKYFGTGKIFWKIYQCLTN